MSYFTSLFSQPPVTYREEREGLNVTESVAGEPQVCESSPLSDFTLQDIKYNQVPFLFICFSCEFLDVDFSIALSLPATKKIVFSE